MQSDNKIFSDFSRLANGAFGSLHGVKKEMDDFIRLRLEAYLDEMDLIRRDEFEALKETSLHTQEQVEKLSQENKNLAQKIAHLEELLKTR